MNSHIAVNAQMNPGGEGRKFNAKIRFLPSAILHPLCLRRGVLALKVFCRVPVRMSQGLLFWQLKALEFSP
jgi:hypothetical protein